MKAKVAVARKAGGVSTLDTLRREYPGDAAWRRFVDFHRPAWARRSDKAEQIRRFGDKDLAIALTSMFGERAEDWFMRPMPALDGRSAADVLRTERSGRTIVRSVTMRID